MSYTVQASRIRMPFCFYHFETRLKCPIFEWYHHLNTRFLVFKCSAFRSPCIGVVRIKDDKSCVLKLTLDYLVIFSLREWCCVQVFLHQEFDYLQDLPQVKFLTGITVYLTFFHTLNCDPAVVAWCVYSSTFSFSRSLCWTHGGSNLTWGKALRGYFEVLLFFLR